ncbi:polyprenyl synthetase family protein [Mycetocola sp. 2940]|uniref:polyprenyl synthetase family protein n=1 Tax=Mycetocola sp. 2940 TaxID=3156452 RepID=UPI0033978F4F
MRITSVRSPNGSRTPETPDAGGVARLESEIKVFAESAPRQTSQRWQGVRERCADGGPALTELIDAAEASDGGKYLRPQLVAAAFLGLGGNDPHLLGEVAGAMQLLHVGLCIHDDIIDGDRMRHGRANLIARVAEAGRTAGLSAADADRQATAAGMLAGDLTLNAALLALLTVSAPGDVRLRLATETASALERTIAGELIDVRSEVTPPEQAEPLRIAELKTACYSVALPLRLGAIAAGVTSESVLDRLHSIGIALGIAYQLVDDDLGLFGSAARTGKSVLSDVQRGKRTEHIREAYSRSDASDREVLDRLLGFAEATEDDVSAVREIVSRTGARDAVLRTVDEHLERGILLAQACPAALAGHLTRLARGMRERTR